MRAGVAQVCRSITWNALYSSIVAKILWDIGPAIFSINDSRMELAVVRTALCRGLGCGIPGDDNNGVGAVIAAEES
jgi:hypothetical protein